MESEGVETQLLIKINKVMPIGWGYYLKVELLKVMKGETPPTDLSFQMGWTVGFNGKTVSKQGLDVYPSVPQEGETFLITFFKNGTINEKVYTAPITGFTDKMGLIWFVKEVKICK